MEDNVSNPVARSQNRSVTIDTSQLCDRCSNIDFDDIFSRELDDEDEEGENTFVADLGSFSQLEESSCPLCQVFATFAPRHMPKWQQELFVRDSYHLRVFNAAWAFTGSSARLRWENNVEYESTNVLGVAPSGKARKTTDDEAFAMRDVLGEKGFLAQDLPEDVLGLCKVRPIDALAFDLTLAKSWLSYCEDNHPTRCCRGVSELYRLRVLDCHSRQLIDAPETCNYVALSYVWGAPAPTKSRPHQFDPVIEDSIAVTLELGFDYLWVDQICIDQSDKEEKLRQIIQMDLIYSNARLTIISAAGTSSSHGLTGINGTPRAQQTTVTLGNRTLRSTLPSPRHIIERTKWNTRGWTYQETALSTKRLVFSDCQVLFECNGMHCYEAIDLPLDSMHDRYIDDRQMLDPLAYDMCMLPAKQPGSDPQEYAYYLMAYTGRDLTYSSDKLNAFQGILSAFQRAKYPVFNHWGVPIFLRDQDFPRPYSSRASERPTVPRSMSTRFAISLFWNFPAEISYARANMDFPSWSWAGWRGVVFESTYRDGTFMSDVHVWFQNSNGTGFTSLDEILRFSPRGDQIKEEYRSGIIQIEGWTAPAHIQDITFTKEEKAREWALAPRDGYFPDPIDGVHVVLNDRSLGGGGGGGGGSIYSDLRSHLMSQPLSRDDDDEFLGFFHKGPDDGVVYGAMLLKKTVKGHYERVGIFVPKYSWRWDKDKKLQKADGSQNLEYTRKRFLLG